MKYGDLSVGWRIEESRIVSVSPCGYTIEIIARGTGQPVSRAHRLGFLVRGHLKPAPDLESGFDYVVEARPSALPVIEWVAVKSPRPNGRPCQHDDRAYDEMRAGRGPDGCSGIMKG
jgi:hypothetical protein